jgi:hypothetical protein
MLKALENRHNIQHTMNNQTNREFPYPNPQDDPELYAQTQGIRYTQSVMGVHHPHAHPYTQYPQYRQPMGAAEPPRRPRMIPQFAEHQCQCRVVERKDMRVDTLEDLHMYLTPSCAVECGSKLQKLLSENTMAQRDKGVCLLNDFMQNSDVHRIFFMVERRCPGYQVCYDKMDGMWYPRVFLQKVQHPRPVQTVVSADAHEHTSDSTDVGSEE